MRLGLEEGGLMLCTEIERNAERGRETDSVDKSVLASVVYRYDSDGLHILCAADN
jgi:hypothetical protein